MTAATTISTTRHTTHTTHPSNQVKATQSRVHKRNAVASPTSAATSSRSPCNGGYRDNFLELSPIQRSLALVLGIVFVAPIHFLYGTLCYLWNAVVKAFTAGSECPRPQPPSRTRLRKRSTASPIRPRDTKPVEPVSSTSASGASSTSDDEEHPSASSTVRKPLPTVLRKLVNPAQKVATNITNIKVRSPHGSSKQSSIDPDTSHSSADSTNRMNLPSLPRRLSFHQVQRILPAVGRRRAMSEATVPILPANPDPAAGERRRAASLPTSLPSSEAPPRRFARSRIPDSERHPDGRPLLALPTVTFEQRYESPIRRPFHISKPSRTRSDSIITSSSSSSSSSGAQSGMLSTSIQEMSEDDDADAVDNGASDAAAAAGAGNASQPSGRLNKLRRKMMRTVQSNRPKHIGS